jgi:intein/homing endonuclease
MFNDEEKVFYVTIDDKEVEITGDHSIMVYRDGKIIECRVEGIRDTDMLLKRKINR